MLLRCCEIFYRIRVVNKELEQNYAETTQHDYLLRISKIYLRSVLTIDKRIHPNHDVLNTFISLFHCVTQFPQISGKFRWIQFISILLGPWLLSVVYGEFKGVFACCVFPNPFWSRIHSPLSILSFAQTNGELMILLPTRLLTRLIT